MGRVLRRVPLDFDWPLEERWKGYLNPHYKDCRECPFCEGNGWSEFALHFYKQWYGYEPFDIAENGSTPYQWDEPAVLEFAKRNVERSPEYYGTGDRVVKREAERLAELKNRSMCYHLSLDDWEALKKDSRVRIKWSTPYEMNRAYISGLGHDSINCYIVLRHRCEKAGKPYLCDVCNEGRIWRSADHQAAFKAWEREDPPRGDGFQLWETVSEGSPVSPVFDSAEGLAAYLSEHNGWEYQYALDWINGPGWAPTFIMTGEPL